MNRILRTLFLLIGLASCKDSATTSPPVYLHGDLEGYVQLVSIDTLVRSNGGVRVSVEGAGRSTITDDRGHWHINDLTTGSYTIRFERDSFGYIRLFNFQFVGGGVGDVPDQILYEAAQPPITLLSVSTAGYAYDVLCLAGKEVVDQMRGVLEFDMDSVKLARTPEYASLVITEQYQLFPRPFDTLRLNDWLPDTTVAAFFPAAQSGTPLFARLGTMAFANWYRGYTQFYDPYVRRTIPSGIGGQSNVVRVRVQ